MLVPMPEYSEADLPSRFLHTPAKNLRLSIIVGKSESLAYFIVLPWFLDSNVASLSLFFSTKSASFHMIDARSPASFSLQVPLSKDVLAASMASFVSSLELFAHSAMTSWLKGLMTPKCLSEAGCTHLPSI